MDDLGFMVQFLVGAKIFLFSSVFRPVIGYTQLPTVLVLGPFSAGVKRQEREAGHSPLSIGKVKEEWKLHRVQSGHFIFTTVFVQSIANIVDETMSQRNVGSGAGRSGVRVPVGERNLYLLLNVHIGSGVTQPPIQWVQVPLPPPGCKPTKV